MSTPDAAGYEVQTEASEARRVPITVSLFGPLRVHYWFQTAGRETLPREITRVFQPRTRELLVLLALHPDGVTREALTDALWASNPPDRVTNALNTALSRLRRAVRRATGGAVTTVMIAGESLYRLDPAVVEVDYWRFAAVVAARRAAVGPERLDVCRAIVDAYGGQLAEGLTAVWVAGVREAARRDALDAVATVARASVESDPEQTLELLEVARGFDPHNEMIYRDIMRLQARLGRLDAIPRTLALLKTSLAEIGEHPTPQVVNLAAALQHRHDPPPPRKPASQAT